jgi:hypothetical protein
MQSIEPCPRFAHQLAYDYVNKVRLALLAAAVVEVEAQIKYVQMCNSPSS